MRRYRGALAATLVALIVAGTAVGLLDLRNDRRVHVTAYFPTTIGLYPGDQIRILGVPVGEIESVTPGPSNAKVAFWIAQRYKVPGDVKAAILSPAVVSARVIALTPAYTGGPVLTDGAVIPEERTAVPVEWDDLRAQLQKLNDSLQPTTPGGVSPLGSLINTGADNVRGEGASIRDAVIKLSRALSALGDHSDDIFSTVKNLSVLVSALRSSSEVTAQLNRNLAQVTNLLSNDPDEVGTAVADLAGTVGQVRAFIADNRETVGTTFDKLSSITTALVENIGDVKQLLHVAPNTLANFANIYRPGQAATTGFPVLNQFANPLQFICGGIQAASRLNYEQSAKLCEQYLAPILKNRQINFPPIGTTLGLAQLPLPVPPFVLPIPVVGEMARPNELTYSEEWLRPDHRPEPDQRPGPADPQPPLPAEAPGLPIVAATPAPADDLQGLLAPAGGGR